ncbi:unnamed protein product [Adineta ricciae]|uniref:Uncharacterized protein n=1 Tax=Adineta ricciae TaxID=249248 RepID=A0A813SQN2_ADIRI|nr:unnamed protein product [Adineta ricciae]CAF1662588.1 unnamed protein product [Adineta ricciae]
MPVLEHYNYCTFSDKGERNVEEKKDDNLICCEWEEAIIREQRSPDIPFDLMEKQTINQVHNHYRDNQRSSS